MAGTGWGEGGVTGGATGTGVGVTGVAGGGADSLPEEPHPVSSRINTAQTLFIIFCFCSGTVVDAGFYVSVYF